MIGWVDLETTGLNPELDGILEVAVVVTDDDLAVLGTYGPIAVRPGVLTPPFYVWPPVVQAMHVKSGLVKEVEQAEHEIGAIDKLCGDWLQSIIEPGTPLAGSTISFDRAFMKKYMPCSEGHFHYRNIDISSVKELCRRWQPEVYDHRPLVSEDEKAHRALDDILATIEEARHYKKCLFEREQNW